jgi:hypothetical protein
LSDLFVTVYSSLEYTTMQNTTTSGGTIAVNRDLIVSNSGDMGKITFIVVGEQCFGHEVRGDFLCSTYGGSSTEAARDEDESERGAWLDLVHKSFSAWARENPY